MKEGSRMSDNEEGTGLERKADLGTSLGESV